MIEKSTCANNKMSKCQIKAFLNRKNNSYQIGPHNSKSFIAIQYEFLKQNTKKLL